jgi:hypothetical protein
VCADSIQWIVQHKSGAWRSLHFCTSREGVVRRVKGLPGWERLLGLPDCFPAAENARRARAGREVDRAGIILPPL